MRLVMQVEPVEGDEDAATDEHRDDDDRERPYTDDVAQLNHMY